MEDDAYFVAQVDELRKTRTWRQLAHEFGINYEQFRGRYRRAKERIETGFSSDTPTVGAGEEDYASLIFEDKIVAEDIDWREFVDLASRITDINDRLDDHNRTATVRITTEKPIAVMYTSDWHLGDGSTDHLGWQRNMELLLETPHLYAIDLGDDRQNARAFKVLAVVLSQVLSPKQQARMLRSVINELTERDKLLAKVDGNHDVEFDERILGEALQAYLLEKMKAPRFRNRGLLKLHVGNELYTNLLFHKSRFSSFLRASHGAMREHQLSFPADVVAGGHDHVPSFEIFWRYGLAREAGFGIGGESYLIKAGTYQDSEYGWKYYHDGGQGNPTVVYWPDRHKKIIFMHPQDAVDYLSLHYKGGAA